MLKLDYYKKAMEQGAYEQQAWVFSVFSVIIEGLNDWKKKPYAYRLVQTPTGYFFCDPEKNLELTLIENAEVGKPLFHFLEPIDYKAKEMLNLDKDITTTIGNVFFNYCCIVRSFGNKIPFLEDEINIFDVENLIASKLEDEGKGKEGSIYVKELLVFNQGISYLTNFPQLCVNAGTEKSMRAPPGVAEFKKQLLEKYKDRLSDPQVIALIDAALVEYDAAFLKGDDCENFLISGKSRKIVRKKLFLMLGAENGLEDKVSRDLIQNSLAEGWDIKNFAAMNNSARAGSFFRSAQTQMGGVTVKELLRASSNITVTQKDCGSDVGIRLIPEAEDIKKLIGYTIIDQGEKVLIEDAEQAGTYLGKSIMRRSPMYCHLGVTDYCFTCVGKNLGENPTGISLTISEYGSAFLALFMSAAHSKGISLGKMDYKKALT